ncbi:cytochrome P450 18a1 [Parasteatoda tepidariorum]|uniref:cytochrome P450 18a1 n=1 Tax=Parasteatoda tepidariorum TaxID=114398 RepID=UPI00077F8D40|nr:cytochrome P450 18a1 [Parasteatoda tepidariorum]
MDTLTILIVSVLVIFLSIWLSKRIQGRKSLPGPIGLPIVGYLPFLTKKIYVKLTLLADTYGPIYSIRMGSRNVLVITDFKLIKEAFASDAFMGRPPDLPIEQSETSQKSEAIIGLPWKEQRRFSLHMLRDLGFGKTKMESHLKEEILELIELIEKENGCPISPAEYLTPSMSNNIASFIFGKRLKHDDPKRKMLNECFAEIGRLGLPLIPMFFPWISKVLDFFNIGTRKKFSIELGKVKKYVREEMREHEATFDPDNIRDFIDAYLLEIQKRAKDVTSTFHRDTLEDLARGFFGAGSETVRLSVEWMLLIYSAYPEVQQKVHAEIDDALGSERFPTWQDRFDMPYTEATILELMRWKPIIPVNQIRYTIADTELNGYFIPKHMDVIAIIYAVSHNKSLWGNDTDEYKPERFLTEDGKKVVKPEYFIPFSIGKRQCPGKPLAEIEVFLYVVALLQKFEVSLQPGRKADLEEQLGMGLFPKKQEIVFKLRMSENKMQAT